MPLNPIALFNRIYLPKIEPHTIEVTCFKNNTFPGFRMHTASGPSEEKSTESPQVPRESRGSRELGWSALDGMPPKTNSYNIITLSK